MEDNGILDTVQTIIIHIWRFRKASDSRWLTLAPASRSLVGACLLGMRSLVGDLLVDDKVSKYHLGGFKKFTTEVAGFTGLVSILGHVPDAVNAALVEDTRLAGRVEEVFDLLVDEVVYVASHPTCCDYRSYYFVEFSNTHEKKRIL